MGVDLRKFPTRLLRNRIKLLRDRNVEILFDVGANRGQYANEMRAIGYNGKIISFEPIQEVYSNLEAAAKSDNNWNTVNMALGDFDGLTDINVSGNLSSSSIRSINDTHVASAPYTATIRKEQIKVAKIDTIIDKYTDGEKNVFVKIDTQGFEKNVIDGAINSIDRIIGFQLELSLVEMYDGEMLFLDMINYLKNLGYSIFSLEPGYDNNESGQLYQVDALFFKD